VESQVVDGFQFNSCYGVCALLNCALSNALLSKDIKIYVNVTYPFGILVPQRHLEKYDEFQKLQFRWR
jgi:hypothetical protein